MPEYDVTPVWDNDFNHTLQHLDDWMNVESEYQTFNDVYEYGEESTWDEDAYEL